MPTRTTARQQEGISSNEVSGIGIVAVTVHAASH